MKKLAISNNLSQNLLFFFVIAFTLLTGLTPVQAAFPTFNGDEGVYIVEEKSGDVLQAQNATAKYYPASTTKLMTALILMEEPNISLDDKVTVGTEIDQFDYNSSTAGLQKGQSVSYKDLLYALLLPSGNDAAETIAVNVGKKLLNNDAADNDTAVKAFVEEMNKKAAALGLKGTHFVNPHGLYNADHYTTPEEMGVIAQEAFKIDTIRQVSTTKKYTLTNLDGTPNEIKNTDLLLYTDSNDYGEVIQDGTTANPYYTVLVGGGKTGNTDEGGRTFVFYSEQGDASIVGVLFKSPQTNDIFSQSKAVLEELNTNYKLHAWTDDTGLYKDVDMANIHFRDGKTMQVVGSDVIQSMLPSASEADYTASIKWDSAIVSEKDGTPRLLKAVTKGEQVGELEIKDGGNVVKTVPVYSNTDLSTKNWVDFIIDNILWITLGVFVVLAVVIIIRKKNGKTVVRKSHKNYNKANRME